MIITFPVLSPTFTVDDPAHRSGASRILFELGKGLRDLGHTVYFVGPHSYCSLSISQLGENMIIIHQISKRIPKSDAIVAGYWTMIMPTLFAGGVLKKGSPFFFVQDFWLLNVMGSFIKDLLFEHIMCRLLRCFDEDNLMAVSQWLSDQVYKETGRKPRVINPGIDHDTFYPRGRKENRKNKRIAYIARTTPWKGLQTFLDAMSIVYKNNPNINVIIAYREPILRNLSFPFHFRLKESINDNELACVYSFCDVFVSTSWYDAFGFPPLEAMACGAPVVAVDSGGIGEYAIDEVNCLLVPKSNPLALANAISRVLKDEALSLKLRKGALETASRFTWTKSVAQFEDVITRGV